METVRYLWIEHTNITKVTKSFLIWMLEQTGDSHLYKTNKTKVFKVQSLSCVWLFAIPWIAAHQASLSITNSRSLPKLMSTQLVKPSSHLILYRPLLLLPPIPPSISLFQWVNSSHEVAKVLEFQFHHQSLQWTPRADLLQNGLVGSPCSLRDSQESSPAPQFKSINS